MQSTMPNAYRNDTQMNIDDLELRSKQEIGFYYDGGRGSKQKVGAYRRRSLKSDKSRNEQRQVKSR